ncbi:MAG: PAS domain S-box protein [Chloroflexi bacterium]|nr:PAS domain S-box protein [Chloroflexota bacterium]
MDKHSLKILYLKNNHVDSSPFQVMQPACAPVELVTVENLTEAMTRLTAEPFEAMLVDSEHITQTDTLTKITQAAPTLPIVIASQAADEHAAVQATHDGAIDYIIRERTDDYWLARVLHTAIERKHLEEMARACEERYQRLVDISPEAIAIHQHGKFVFVNPAGMRLVGAKTPQEILGKPILEVVVPNYHAVVAQRNRQLIEGAPISLVEEKFIRLDGTVVDGEVIAAPITYLGEPATQVIVRDISDRKTAERESLQNAERYRILFENMMDGLAYCQMIYENDQPQDFVYLDVNTAFETLTGLKNVVGKRVTEIIPGIKESNPEMFEIYGRVARTGNGERFETYVRALDIWFSVLVFSSETERFVAVFENVTERKCAENELRKSEARFRSLSESAPIGIFQTDAEGKTTFANQQFLRTLEIMPEKCLGYEWFNAIKIYPNDRTAVLEQRHTAITSGEDFNSEFRILVADAQVRWVKMHSAALRDQTGKPIGRVGTLEDITEQRQHERELQTLIQVGTSLRVANTRNQMLPLVLNQLMDLLHSSGAVVAMRDSATDNVQIELALGSSASLANLRIPPGDGIIGQVIATGKPYPDFQNQIQSIKPEHPVAYAPLIAQGKTIGAIAVSRPESPYTANEVAMLMAITEISANAINRAMLHEQTQARLRQLTALRNIDQAITSSLDLRVTLEVLLDQVITQLKADATCILLIKPKAHVLEFIAGKGFRTRSVQKTQVWLGQNFAGQAVLDRKTILIQDCRNVKGSTVIPSPFATMIQLEKFMGYCAVPLIAKGQVKGVLEIFQRTPLRHDKEWLTFLEALAGQAAIAIDNASLFDGLQQANIEMIMAYDATIEGWSRALDLRDHETEGHSTRVTEMTLRLARKFGLTDQELIHIRRGALLHDIGKMGVPDSILRKPDKLDEEELAYMQRHPEFAYQLLSPIEYLKPAIDIPLYHHERWDGTGYPRHLAGKAIPLSARLFAVVDVWDALTSDRPYRAAWTPEQALKFIQNENSKHFDPKVVEMFLKLEIGV